MTGCVAPTRGAALRAGMVMASARDTHTDTDTHVDTHTGMTTDTNTASYRTQHMGHGRVMWVRDMGHEIWDMGESVRPGHRSRLGME